MLVVALLCSYLMPLYYDPPSVPVPTHLLPWSCHGGSHLLSCRTLAINLFSLPCLLLKVSSSSSSFPVYFHILHQEKNHTFV